MTLTKSFSKFFFTRSDSNSEEVRAYLAGLLQGKHRSKNMERMEETVEGFSYQRVHNSISTSPWEHRPLMDEIARRADGLLGGSPRSRLVIDDTGIQKKGHKSVGVARQYIGRLGKVENCQIAVCTSLASGQQSMLTDIRLYLPEQWCSDADRCEDAGIPLSEREFKTKSQIALESVTHQRQLGVRFDVVSMDSGYGSDGGLRHRLDESGEIYVAEVHRDARIWVDAPWSHDQGKRSGKRLKKAMASHPAQGIDQWAAAAADTEWRRLKVRDSDQGWVEVSYLAARVWVEEGGEEKLRWALAWENPDETSNDGRKGQIPRRHYALSNAAADEDPRLLVADAVERNVVERNFRDAKTHLGMADYQTRGWLAWHHHMALVMLLAFFLTQEKMHSPKPKSEEESINMTIGDLSFVLERLLPQKTYGPPNESKVKRMLEVRLSKRHREQALRRRATKKARPPLFPDEDFSK